MILNHGLEDSWDEIAAATRIVIKIGTKSLLLDDGSFDFKTIASIVQSIKELVRGGKEVVLVSSGAVSAGMKKLGMDDRPRDVVMQQVAASVGNPLLLNEYVRMFGDMPVAQVLLTQQDLSNRKSYLHFRNTMERLMREKIVPVVNENDVISIDELVGTKSGESEIDYNFSDNDVLSALVATSLGAGLLVILSDVDGLYTKHPDAKGSEFVPFVEKIDDHIKRMGKDGSKFGRGGMVTKLRAAEICTRSNVWMVIAHAKKSDLPDLLQGLCKCTIFKPEMKLPSKHLWMVFAANVEGKIFLDDGAVRALDHGASILLPGIRECRGDFNKNAVIEIYGTLGSNCIGKGITKWSSQEIRRFKELYETDPASFRDQKVGEIIHRDNIAFIL
ncbi:MAG: glutamate 5-kinase [Promethearchaeota archaeon]